MRIGLFGGTFNPIHRCHLAIADYARAHLALDQILFIPTGDPPHKSSASLAPAHHRLEMVRLAIAEYPSFGVSDVEIRRPTKSYSVETVRELQRDKGSDAALFFIIGLDAFLEFPTWKQASDLLRACHFVVLRRPGSSFRALLTMPLMPPVDQTSLAALDAQQARQVTAPIPGGGSLTLLCAPACDVSASDIRRRFKQRVTVSTLLPAPVESYIMRTNLYQEGSDQSGV